MKITKKLMLSSLALALVAAPAVTTLPHNNINTVQATRRSTRNTIKLTSLSDIKKVPVYNRNGKQLNGQTVNPGSSFTFYGKPIIVQQKYNMDLIFAPQKINGHEYVWLGDNGYVLANHTGGSIKNRLSITRDVQVVNAKGQNLRSYRGGSAVLKKGSTVTYAGKTTYNIAVSYFNVGNGRYIRAGYVQQMNGKPVMLLNHNTFIYNKSGRRISFQGQSKLLHGGVVTTNSQTKVATASDQNYFYQSDNYKNKAKLALKMTRIKGQNYVAIGKNAYIKVANVRTVNGMILFSRGPVSVRITGRLNGELYNSDFSKTKQQLSVGQRINLTKASIDNSISDPQLYFKIQGSDKLVYWGDLGEYPDRNAAYDPDYSEGSAFWFSQFLDVE